MAVEESPMTSEPTQLAEVAVSQQQQQQESSEVDPRDDASASAAATGDAEDDEENGELKKEDKTGDAKDNEENGRLKKEDEKGDAKDVEQHGGPKKEDEPKTVEVAEGNKINNDEAGEASSPPTIGRSGTFKEESDSLPELKEHEKKALIELRSMLEYAIIGNKLLKDAKIKEPERPKSSDKPEEKNAKEPEETNEKEPEKRKSSDKPEEKSEKEPEEKNEKEPEKPKSSDKPEEKNEKSPEGHEVERPPEQGREKDSSLVEEEEKPANETDQDKKESTVEEAAEEEKPANKVEETRETAKPNGDDEEKGMINKCNEKEDSPLAMEERRVEEDKDIKLWGVPLLPSKGDKGTDVVLLKLLRAKEFKVNDAFEMLRNILQWRKEFKIDTVLEEDFGADLNSAAQMSGVDREGHPVFYIDYGVFGNEEIYDKAFGSEERREKFLRWRSQMMEKGIQRLDFKPGGVSSLVQVNDLKNTPGPARKELRLATKSGVGLLQDNYPELIERNIFINVPFWYYAFNALLPPFLTQRNKSKYIFVRPAKVTETLLK